MTPPDVKQSTKEERLKFVQSQWQCMNNCELCGKCHLLKGKEAEVLYEDYIEGKSSYMEVTFKIRNNNY
ncbi:MAG: hypothetical protein J6U44_05200 [Paludibacteraceae bacterium]|nr:hypothetical protein [Paludibacteraceae bacterium]MBO7316538.1 hypothetical protein [Paludibacteraceae bacterium]